MYQLTRRGKRMPMHTGKSTVCPRTRQRRTEESIATERTCVWRSAEDETIGKGIDTPLPTMWLRTQCPLLQPQPGWLASRLLCILPIYLFKHLLFRPPIFSANIDRFFYFNNIHFPVSSSLHIIHQ